MFRNRTPQFLCVLSPSLPFIESISPHNLEHYLERYFEGGAGRTTPSKLGV